MGKCIAGPYRPYVEITVCDDCFHKDVCGDKDYLTENTCFDFYSREKIQRYEDLAEQGRLVELPVRIDDTIYQLRKKRHIKGEGISPRIVGYVTILGNGEYELNHQGLTPCRESEFGKTWFLQKRKPGHAWQNWRVRNEKN